MYFLLCLLLTAGGMRSLKGALVLGGEGGWCCKDSDFCDVTLVYEEAESCVDRKDGASTTWQVGCLKVIFLLLQS